MLKLLKYDLKGFFSKMIYMYIILLILALISRALGFIQNVSFMEFLSGFSTSLCVTGLTAIVIRTVIVLWLEFVESIYKDKSYLTHTLPYSKQQIYNAKILTTLIGTLAGVIVGIILMVICFSGRELITKIIDELNTMIQATGVSLIQILSALIASIFIEINYIILTGYNGIEIGYGLNVKGKQKWSIIIGCIIYLVISTLMVGVIFLIGLFNPEIMKALYENTTDIHIIKQIFSLGLALYSIATIGLYINGYIKLNKGVNVE